MSISCGGTINLLYKITKNLESGITVIESIEISDDACDVTDSEEEFSISILIRGPNDKICRKVTVQKTYDDVTYDIQDPAKVTIDSDCPTDPVVVGKKLYKDVKTANLNMMDIPDLKAWIGYDEDALKASLGWVKLDGELIDPLEHTIQDLSSSPDTDVLYRSARRGPQHQVFVRVPGFFTDYTTESIYHDTSLLSIEVEAEFYEAPEGQQATKVKEISIEEKKAQGSTSTGEIQINDSSIVIEYTYMGLGGAKEPLIGSRVTRTVKSQTMGVSKLVGTLEPVVAASAVPGDEAESVIETLTYHEYDRDYDTLCGYLKISTTTATYQTLKEVQFFDVKFLVPPIVSSNPVSTFCKAYDLYGMKLSTTRYSYHKQIEEAYKCDESDTVIGVSPEEEISIKPKRGFCLNPSKNKKLLIFLAHTVFSQYGDVGGVNITIAKRMSPFGDYEVNTSAGFSAGPPPRTYSLGLRGYTKFQYGDFGSPKSMTLSQIIKIGGGGELEARRIAAVSMASTVTCGGIGTEIPTCGLDGKKGWLAAYTIDYIMNRVSATYRVLPEFSQN